MKNIAVLYDVENLVGGYHLKYLSEISLKNIISELEKIGLSEIAIQKAYADWSNAKLNQLKWDIAELGIEPIQMYGFSKGSVKNASDIQLVIDAMEILHTKPFIDTFVIISGDGGFASLVKKISEYGKKVIGMAYKNTANQIFTKVCDKFIYIDNTLTKEQIEILKEIELDENKKKHILEHPLLNSTLPNFKPIDDFDLDSVKKYSLEFMNKLSENMEAKKIMREQGLNISVFKSALNYLFIELNFRRFGFARLSDFVRYIFSGSDYKLVLKEPSDYRIVFDDVKLFGYNDMEPIFETPKIHSKENYERFLPTGKPPIHIPLNKLNFQKVIDYLLEHREEYSDKSYTDIFNDLYEVFGIEERELNKILYLLINTGVLKGDNPIMPLKEQHYYFSPLNKEELKSQLLDTIRQKLIVSIDGTIDEDEFAKIEELFF
jgi:uncharacterized protein (TIGR00288 family)